MSVAGCDLSWTQSYFKDPVTGIGAYVALLLLRFERRNNYEKIIDLEELLSQAKLSLRRILGSTSAERAYSAGLTFLEDFFKHFPEALQAKPRFRLLESIEGLNYDQVRKHYITVVLSEIKKLDVHERAILHRMLEGIRTGRVPLIDKTVCGSTYLLKTDLFYYATGLRHIDHMLELQHILVHSGILLPEYSRIIVPAPLTEEMFLKSLLRTGLDLTFTDIIARKLSIVGYTLAETRTLETSTCKILVLEFQKQVTIDYIYRIRLRLYLAADCKIDTPEVQNKILQDLAQIPRPNIAILICRQAGENFKRVASESGVLVIELRDLDISQAKKYIADKIQRILLEISASATLHDMLTLLQDLYSTMLE